MRSPCWLPLVTDALSRRGDSSQNYLTPGRLLLRFGQSEPGGFEARDEDLNDGKGEQIRATAGEENGDVIAAGALENLADRAAEKDAADRAQHPAKANDGADHTPRKSI